MRRREFVAGFIGAAWPLVARAQEHERMRRIGVFLPGVADDLEIFLQALGELGWTVGRNLRITHRRGAGDVERYRAIAAELVALSPDLIMALGSATATAVQKITRTVPIVFVNVTDPVGTSLVASLSRPGGNATGFTSQEFGFSGKWLEVLKEIAPQITRVGVTRDSAIASQIGLFGGLQSVAPSFGVELRPIDLHDAADISRAIAAFAGEPNGGLIVGPGAKAILHRDLIVGLAARHRLPAVYTQRRHVATGGLISYASDNVAQFRQAASYVDRILKGEKPADMPVQPPTKYELVINLKTARSLDLTIPPSLLARADEVIE